MLPGCVFESSTRILLHGIRARGLRSSTADGQTNTEKLNISNNFSDFGGSLPSTIGDLVFLVELDLSFNQVKMLPMGVGALENLKVLKVDNNPLVDPPLEVVEHSMEALLEYMSERWKMFQTYDNYDDEDLGLGGSRTPTRATLYNVCASPLATPRRDSNGHQYNMKTVGFEASPVRTRSSNVSTTILHWLGGITCMNGRNSIPNLSLHHNPLSSTSSPYHRHHRH